MSLSFCFKKIKHADKQHNKQYYSKTKTLNHYKLEKV